MLSFSRTTPRNAYQLGRGGANGHRVGVAMIVACLVGTLALRFISVRVDPVSLRRFGYYTAVMGVAAILTA